MAKSGKNSKMVASLLTTLILLMGNFSSGAHAIEAPKSRERETKRTSSILSKTRSNPIYDGLSDVEKRQVEQLWTRTVRESSEVKDLSARYSGAFSESEIERVCFRIFDKEVLKLSEQPPVLGISLTIPDLEPDYPVPGGQKPAYLRNSNRVQHVGASLGAGGALVQEQSLAASISEILIRLVTAYKTYKGSFAQQIHSDQEARISARKTLSCLATVEAVDQLDIQLKAGTEYSGTE